MKVKILKGVSFPNPDYKEYKVGEIVETSKDMGENLIKIGFAEAVEKVEEVKSLDEPPEDKMIHKTKKKGE